AQETRRPVHADARLDIADRSHRRRRLGRVRGSRRSGTRPRGARLCFRASEQRARDQSGAYESDAADRARTPGTHGTLAYQGCVAAGATTTTNAVPVSAPASARTRSHGADETCFGRCDKLPICAAIALARSDACCASSSFAPGTGRVPTRICQVG